MYPSVLSILPHFPENCKGFFSFFSLIFLPFSINSSFFLIEFSVLKDCGYFVNVFGRNFFSIFSSFSLQKTRSPPLSKNIPGNSEKNLDFPSFSWYYRKERVFSHGEKKEERSLPIFHSKKIFQETELLGFVPFSVSFFPLTALPFLDFSLRSVGKPGWFFSPKKETSKLPTHWKLRCFLHFKIEARPLQYRRRPQEPPPHRVLRWRL